MLHMYNSTEVNINVLFSFNSYGEIGFFFVIC